MIRFKSLGDGDGISWAMYPRKRGITNTIRQEWDGLGAYYNGPGLHFGREPMMRVTRTRILVTQYHGLDI